MLDDRVFDLYAGVMPRLISPEQRYANHSDASLLAVNRQYTREYLADPTPARLIDVNESGEALSARGL